MPQQHKAKSSNMIDPTRFGVSFSIKQCRAFGINPYMALDWLLDDAGFRRFRLMSYWDEHETSPGNYDFSMLDAQIQHIAQYGGHVTVCLGARQPRWPENHWPDWAWKLDPPERTKALLKYVEHTVKHLKKHKNIVSWQLENEALLRSFGTRPDINRSRLRQEYALVRRLDTKRPIIMSTSNAWGIPVFGPIPDIVGFSHYTVIHARDAYHRTLHRPWIHRFRRWLIWFWWDRPCFIHELQCEPWGPTAIWKMSIEEQDKSMNVEQIEQNIQDAKQINAFPVDLWGAEWWYWRLHVHDDPSIWHAVRDSIIL